MWTQPDRRKDALHGLLDIKILGEKREALFKEKSKKEESSDNELEIIKENDEYDDEEDEDKGTPIITFS